jgi:hypothetical protein
VGLGFFGAAAQHHRVRGRGVDDDFAIDLEVGADMDELSDDVLDRIDEIVQPGVSINRADNGWTSPALQAPARRR